MKKLFLCLLVIGFVLPAFAEGGKESAAAGGEYPTRAVEVIVPWAAGGSTDTVTRALMSVMGQYFPEPMAVINKPGGGGTVGTTFALNEAPDGYTILVNSWGAFVTQPALTTLQYGPEDYEPVLQISYEPRILVAHPDTPYDDIKGMIDYAKQNPGGVHVGIAAVGATDHFAMLELQLQYGVDMTITPQGGGGPSKIAVLGHHTDVAALTAGEAGPLVEAKELKALGVMDSKRYSAFPNIPTTAELGIPVESGVANHLYVPAGVPADRVKKIHDAFKSAMEDPGFLELAKKLKLSIEYLDGEASRKQLTHFRELYTEIAEKLGMKQ